ncbi:MAG: NAD(P)/FAD-dependent oxidoreductase [Rhodobacteraceae bacterium]|jgi:3-phenylpropionate/trans-cinnamate dioxygenase ferredoxin reductase subunit|uniref:3-phenylpropionate/trans-cinnamate dioxygenase ferredoxin reductase subunit n=1 Tax=Salipiger profundus TaxID=1229727 RepID=A0A1U7D4Y5_9RHOB|nr:MULTISPECIES: FAD/NAD(P)-binding oxidoreductase [Salipiger]APX23136.1 3-phenylpropionate/trans-cinnamate dioxygenase ferredoxin reductase subunit [Salipiger profundus]MAB04794.1 NAD(P)/FAD-dependent oxidoreductase [Paracoccaceae bacterium]GGA13535.1 pyridine nucleotide-disulfide oxidoreductase [Salipiger profundus]SFD18267.1 3-phenylpropionate/trans-cinnamate dioxygenase ferredoxin reductase subunit [Salipiger profundus]
MGNVVVIGGGQAGASLVARLRGKGFEGGITMIGAEPVPPYQRPPLSKAYLLGDMEEDRLFLRPRAFYDDQDIELILGTPVTAVDTESQTIIADGRKIPYDDLVFCTGSAPRRLPAAIGGDLGGVFAVRGIADVDAMRPRFTEGARLLIVGGGYIGLEAAAVASKLGLKVTLVEMAERILQRVAAPETADYFRDLHTRHGVDIREGVGLGALTGTDGQVSAAELTDGSTLDVDFVIAGVGILPEIELAEAAGLAIENGIRTDRTGRTSAPNVWAAGDCASFPYRGAQLRLESVGNAIDQAEAVADNIMGAGRAYEAKPWFWSDQYDVKLQIAGLNTGYDRVVVRGGGDAVSHWYFAGQTLVALDAMNDPRAYMVGKRLIEAGRSPAPEAVADPDSDLKALLKA